MSTARGTIALHIAFLATGVALFVYGYEFTDRLDRIFHSILHGAAHENCAWGQYVLRYTESAYVLFHCPARDPGPYLDFAFRVHAAIQLAGAAAVTRAVWLLLTDLACLPPPRYGGATAIVVWVLGTPVAVGTGLAAFRHVTVAQFLPATFTCALALSMSALFIMAWAARGYLAYRTPRLTTRTTGPASPTPGRTPSTRPESAR